MDCADRDRIDEARQELHRIINDREMRDAIILIFANKQDLPEGKGWLLDLRGSSWGYLVIIVNTWKGYNTTENNHNIARKDDRLNALFLPGFVFFLILRIGLEAGQIWPNQKKNLLVN